MEQRARKGKRKGILQQAILGSLLVGGAIIAPALAFSVIGAVGTLASMCGKKRYYASDVGRSLESLLEKEFVEFVSGPKKHLRITSKGRKYLEELEGTRYQLKRPRKWDKQYRVVIVDIKEQRKGIRERLRHVLAEIYHDFDLAFPCAGGRAVVAVVPPQVDQEAGVFKSFLSINIIA